MSAGIEGIAHPLLEACGVAHGFGRRDDAAPPHWLHPTQVHGVDVAEAGAEGLDRESADAVVSAQPGVPVGVVTADCVPVLAASADGRCVAAIHAGWRGLAAGVVARGMGRLRALAGPGATLCAVIGPHIGPCCYEVDEPVLCALRERFGAPAVADALSPSRPGHGRLDLAALVLVDLAREGVPGSQTGRIAGACTFCDAQRFHSFRRDGAGAGRTRHAIAARGRT